MSNSRLYKIITEKHDFIFTELIRRLEAPPRSRYQTFMKSSEGAARVQQWMKNLQQAIAGDPAVFLSDTEEVGYLRAHQGYRIDFIFRFYMTYQAIIRELLDREVAEHPTRSLVLFEEFHLLSQILTHALQLVTASFLKTREEIIAEKVTHLELLSDFTREIISNFSVEKIAKYIQKDLVELFGAHDSVLALHGDDNTQRLFACSRDEGQLDAILPIMKATRKAGVTLFMAQSGKITRNIYRSEIKQIVSIPIQAKRRRYGVLVFYARQKGFRFTEKEHDFLLQFINIIVIALENALMLEEIDQSRQDFRMLAGNIIQVQEARRKRLAGDIHDTLTQTLTGIGYKIQFCKELHKADPGALQEQLDILIETVHGAIAQSRQITSSLHPDLIVNLGLVPALKRHIDNFVKETGIHVHTDFSDDIHMSYAVNICLFRMVQEALTNVVKHANTDHVDIALERNGQKIRMRVSDNGRGIKRSDMRPELKRGKKMGLMILKERVESVGGSFAIQTGSGKGCKLEAVIDIENGEGRHEDD